MSYQYLVLDREEFPDKRPARYVGSCTRGQSTISGTRMALMSRLRDPLGAHVRV